MKKIILHIIALLILLLLLAGKVSAQDAQYSQFYANYLYLGPSFAGLSGNSRISMNYRNQWPSIGNGFVSYSGSFDHYFDKFHSGIGALVMKDVAGTGELSTLSMSLHYSFDFKLLNSFHCRPGLTFGYVNRSFDMDKVTWNDQMRPDGNNDYSDERHFFLEDANDIDFGASVLTYSDKFWLGMSVDHLLKPNQSLKYHEGEEENQAFIPIKYSVYGGTKFVAKERLLRPIPTSLQLAFLYKSQGEYHQLDLGIYWYRSPLVLGLWYRGIPFVSNNDYNDALVMLIGYRTNHLNIGYSYDFTTSQLIVKSGGSHEISMSWNFKSIEKKKKHNKMVPCPEF